MSSMLEVSRFYSVRFLGVKSCRSKRQEMVLKIIYMPVDSVSLSLKALCREIVAKSGSMNLCAFLDKDLERILFINAVRGLSDCV